MSTCLTVPGGSEVTHWIRQQTECEANKQIGGGLPSPDPRPPKRPPPLPPPPPLPRPKSRIGQCTSMSRVGLSLDNGGGSEERPSSSARPSIAMPPPPRPRPRPLPLPPGAPPAAALQPRATGKFEMAHHTLPGLETTTSAAVRDEDDGVDTRTPVMLRERVTVPAHVRAQTLSSKVQVRS